MWKKGMAAVAVLGLFGWCVGCDKPSFKPEFSTPEKALQSLEDAYRTKNLENVLMCKDFALEARFFMGKRAGSMSREVVKQHATLLEEKFKKHLAQGFPEWKGVTARILGKEELSGDVVIVTEELLLPNGEKMTQRVFVGRSKDGWKVLMPYSDQRKDAWLKRQEGMSVTE